VRTLESRTGFGVTRRPVLKSHQATCPFEAGALCAGLAERSAFSGFRFPNCGYDGESVSLSPIGLAVSFRVTVETRERPRQDISRASSAGERGSKSRSLEARERAPSTSGEPARVTLSVARNPRRLGRDGSRTTVFSCFALCGNPLFQQTCWHRDESRCLFGGVYDSGRHRNRPTQLVEDSTPSRLPARAKRRTGRNARVSWPGIFDFHRLRLPGRSWSSGDAAFGEAEPTLSTPGRGRALPSSKQTWANRGVLRFSDGGTLTLACKGLCHPGWTLRSPTGEAVLWLHARGKNRRGG